MSSPRPSPFQDLAWRIEALGFDLIGAFTKLLPIDWASALGGVLFRLVGPLSSAHKTARRNLQIAFPDMGQTERNRLLSAQWDNVGRLLMEFQLTHRLTEASGRVQVEGMERLHAVRDSGQPVVMISGHFSNWEVMAIAISVSGAPCQVTYRSANNPYIDQRIIDSRRRYGVKLLAPKGGIGSRDLLEAVHRGQSVALLNDQKFNAGLPLPFFGVTAYTAPGAARLALRASGVIQPMSVQRLKGARFRVVVHEPIVLERTADRTFDIEQGVRRINAFIEERVRARPQEWFWVHKRWPSEAYAALDAQS